MSPAPITSICVYCGSSSRARAEYFDAARATAQALTSLGLGLVYGGAKVGLMGVVADTVLACGGHAVGIIPRALVEKEVAHPGLTEQHIVESMHDRKALMAELAGGFLALPGGFGTLDELMEALTLIQTGKARKIPLILVCSDFWGGLIDWFKARLVGEGMVDPEDIHLIQVIDEPEKVVEAIFKHYEARPFGPLPNEHEMLLNL